MLHAARIIGTDRAKTGLIGAGVGAYTNVSSPLVFYQKFSATSISSAINSNDGYELDNTQEVVDSHSTSEDLQKYFDDKREAIRSSFNSDSNSAAASGTSASELSDWLDRKNELLELLENQKDDAFDLASYVSSSDGSSDEGSDGGSDEASDVGSNEAPEEASNEASNGDSSEQSQSFPQNSEEITQTEFDSSDYYDD